MLCLASKGSWSADLVLIPCAGQNVKNSKKTHFDQVFQQSDFWSSVQHDMHFDQVEKVNFDHLPNFERHFSQVENMHFNVLVIFSKIPNSNEEHYYSFSRIWQVKKKKAWLWSTTWLKMKLLENQFMEILLLSWIHLYLSASTFSFLVKKRSFLSFKWPYLYWLTFVIPRTGQLSEYRSITIKM